MMKLSATPDRLVVGIPVRNQLPFVRTCLQAVARRMTPGTRILIVDDASDVACQDHLRWFAAQTPNADLLRNEHRRGFPYNCNEIIYNTSAETICLLNSDTIVAPNWDRFILEVMALDDAFALAGPSTSFTHTAQSLPGLFRSRMAHTLESVAGIGQAVHQRFQGQYQPLPTLGGFCLFFERELVRRIGYFDERFGLGCGEEDDFTHRAREAGYEAIWVKYAYVHHFGHCSFSQELGTASAELWAINNLICQLKRRGPDMGEIVHQPTNSLSVKS